MVPLSLTLRNFLSYGDDDTTLDFSGIRVVCLSGENGHGKSALLDAITWALWGETRLGRQGHEQLIRIGADEMSVVFKFRVAGAVYRVKRQRSRRTGAANWEIQRESGSGEWKALTGTSAADTGRIIQQIVHMSYDTFLNSAYLRQGRADEFVRQSSGRRKEILCEVLELSRYDRLEEMAKQRSKDAAALGADYERQANQAHAIAADAERYAGELSESETRLSELAERHRTMSDLLRNTERERSELLNQIDLRNRLTKQLSTVERGLEEAKNERRDSSSKIEKVQKILAGRKTIEERHAALLTVRARGTEISPALQELQQVQLSLVTADSAIKGEESRLRHAADRLNRDILTAESNLAEEKKFQAEIDALTVRKRAFVETERRAADLRSRHTELSTQIALLRAEHAQFGREIGAVAERRGRLLDQTENCSVCGSPLPPDRIESLIEECDSYAADLKSRQDEVKQSGVSAQREQAETAKKLKEEESALAEMASIQEQLIRLEQMLRQAVAGSEPLSGLRIERDALNRTIDSGAFALEHRKTSDTLSERFAVLEPLKQEFDQLAETAKTLADAEKIHRELTSAEQSLDSEQRLLALAVRQVESLDLQRCELMTQIAGLADIEKKLNAAEEDLRAAAGHERQIAAEMSGVQKSIGRLQHSLKLCSDSRVQAAAFEAQREKEKLEENLHKVLAGAFGKRGIQASIIESALPELQQFTNDILDRLTDGDMRVFIETTRLAKTKNVAPVETLDIKISDSLGTRPLEMYSGGEAFRVSFALRIALSKLLVRRSGAELQTLIIDEGFGTQDGKGREKLIDAINAIKMDFEQILVITHIDELKEAFGTRIEVYKTSEGSQLRVVYGDAIG